MTKELKKAPVMPEESAQEAPKPLTLEERKAEINNIITCVNKAILDNDEKARASQLELLDEAIADYNLMLRKKEYAKWLESDAPVLNALKQGEVTQIKRKKINKKDEVEKWGLNENAKVIVDLIEFNEIAGADKKIFVSGQWIHRIENWKDAVTAYNADKIEDKDASRAIKEILKSLSDDEPDFNFNGTLSKNILKKTAQIMVDNIVASPDDEKPFIFEGKDLEYIKNHAFKASNKNILGSTSPRKETIIQLFTRALHRIVTGGAYKQEIK